jgi:protein-disulfide isomerase
LQQWFRRVTYAVLAIVWALAVAGCSSDQLLQANSLTVEPAKATGSSAYAVADKKAEAPPFNPFRDASSNDYGRREVIAKPTLDEVLKVGTLPEMALGRKDAPVTVVKYASLTCPHCRRFQMKVFPVFKREYIDTGKVRFITREFPIGRSSGNATIALRCVSASKYFKLYDLFLRQQARWVSQEVRLDKIHAVAAQVGLSRSQFDACLKNQDLIQGLKWVKDRGRTLGIIGTPNFFIQNKLVKKVLDIDDLRGLVDAELGARKTVVAN